VNFRGAGFDFVRIGSCPRVARDVSVRDRRKGETENSRFWFRTNRYIMALCSSMWFGGRVKRSNKKLDENFGRNLSSFIIRYR
jgi:hypothetical protein